MKHIYLSHDYLRAIKREINKRLENQFLYFSTPDDTTYYNDECGSFEFTVNKLTFKIYTPDKLGDEVYTLFLPNERPIKQANNLTDIFNEIEQFFKN